MKSQSTSLKIQTLIIIGDCIRQIKKTESTYENL